MASDFLGMTFGSYKLVAPLGQGGMGAVFRGYQESIDRSVAVKLLPANLLANPNFLSRFVDEARALARLTHPAILPLYEYGHANGVPYIVMPVMTGGSLAKRIKDGPLPLATVVEVLTPIAAGLDFAHEQNVLHCDVKPSNILFDGRDNALLSDFGLAKILKTDLDPISGVVSGTPGYMSPEQALAHKLDGRSDLYSLAVVAYEALAGRTPFQSRNAVQLAMKHVNEPPPDLRELRPELSKAVDEIVLKALEKKPEARYASPGEFLQALSNAAYLSRDFWRPVARHTPAAEEPEPEPSAPAAPEGAPAQAAPPKETLPMDRPTLSEEMYTQIAALPGVDPFDVPDPTQIGPAGDFEAPEAAADDDPEPPARKSKK